ncbi:MAG TPA: cobalamin-binding protein, partial [Gammaproteobacteria bacterium]|nr:cobalamin-binding protein [Gammaproteobacteria bacterium]
MVCMGFLIRVSVLIIAVAAGQVVADVQVRDALGNMVTLPRPAERIVSLAPHLTENLFAAGAGPKLVGTVQSCDYPPAAQQIPRVGGHAGLDLESIVSLDPDLIVAWASGNRREDIGRLRRLGFTIYLSEPRQLDDIPDEIEKLGELAATVPTARRSARDLRSRLRQLRHRYSALRPVRIFYQLWHQPLMTVNGEQIISKAMALCGGRNIFAGLPALAPSVTVEAV